MRRLVLARAFRGLRVRVALLLVAGVAFQAVGFEALITTLTRRWLILELQSRNRAVAMQLADRAELPMVVGDSLQLQAVTRSAKTESDVIGIAVYTPDGH